MAVDNVAVVDALGMSASTGHVTPKEYKCYGLQTTEQERSSSYALHNMSCEVIFNKRQRKTLLILRGITSRWENAYIVYSVH